MTRSPVVGLYWWVQDLVRWVRGLVAVVVQVVLDGLAQLVGRARRRRARGR